MAYSIEIYRLNVATGQFSRIDAIVNGSYKNLSFSENLNGVGQCQFELDIYSPKASPDTLQRFRNHVCIKRNDSVVWFGPITNIESDYDNVSGSVTVQANTMLYHYKDRYTTAILDYTAQDMADIAQAFITSETAKLNGSFGVAVGSTPTTQDIDIQFEKDKRIADCLIELASRDIGIDFNFVPNVGSSNLVETVSFNVFFPLGSVRTDLAPLRIGDNVKTVRLSTISGIYNAGTAYGAGTGSEVLSQSYNDTASQVAYSRREKVEKQGDVAVAETLLARITETIYQTSVERFALDLTLYPGRNPQYGTYGVGDIFNVDLDVDNSGGYINLQGQARIIGLQTSIDDVGVEDITPRLELFN